jgi:hypothetical protein
MMTFKSFARLKRKEAGLLLKECSQALGYAHESSFLQLENDKYPHRWSLKNFWDFAGLLGMRPSELMAEYESWMKNQLQLAKEE